MSTTPSGISASFGDGEAAAFIAGEELLSKDSIPDENQRATCFSCEQVLVDVYCHACGQRNDNYRRSIFALGLETFASVFSLENRIWRTWMSLIIRPGKVSREFADGRRTIWTSPVRIYLAMSIILFGYMSLTETHIFSVRTDIVARDSMTGNVQYMDDQSVKLAPKFGFFRRQAEIDTLNANTDFDRVSRLMKGTPKQVFVYNGDPTQLNASLNDENLKTYGVWPKEEKDQPDADTEITSKRNRALSSYSDNVENALSVYNDILSLTRNPETIGDRIIKAHEQGKQLDLFNELHPSVNENGKAATRDSLEILDQRLSNLGLTRASFNILPTNIEQGLSINLGEGQIGDLNLSQVDIQRISVQVLRNPALLNEGISRYLPRIMFLMMPLAAFIGIGFIRGRRNALLYDHLVHAAYIHAVTFGFLVVLILLAQWTPIPASFNIFLIGMMIYLPLSAKRMFQRGWFKTIIASYGIATIYALVMLIVVTILTATSVKQAVEMGQL